MKANWTRVLLILIPYVLIVGTYQLLAYKILNLDVSDQLVERSIIERFVITFFIFLGTYLTILLFRKYIDNDTVHSLGFEINPLWLKLTLAQASACA